VRSAQRHARRPTRKQPEGQGRLQADQLAPNMGDAAAKKPFIPI
jgi:hypothetical protein